APNVGGFVRLAAGGSQEALDRAADLAGTEPGVEALLETLPALRGTDERALALLLLLRGGVEKGRQAVYGAARGTMGDEFRIPAVLALAGGGEGAVALLEELARSADDPALMSAALFSLSTGSTDAGRTALSEILQTAPDAAHRSRVYEAISGSLPAGVVVGTSFFAALQAGRAGPGPAPDPAPVRRLVATISAEWKQELMPAAAGALACLPAQDADEGILEIWGRAEGEVRPQVLEGVLGHRPREDDSSVLVELARLAPGPEEIPLRQRVLDGVRDLTDRSLLEALEGERRCASRAASGGDPPHPGVRRAALIEREHGRV
ncbi:MAG: hypothetical protein ACYTDY_12185, partial [Planctomycetota bacterium]